MLFPNKIKTCTRDPYKMELYITNIPPYIQYNIHLLFKDGEMERDDVVQVLRVKRDRRELVQSLKKVERLKRKGRLKTKDAGMCGMHYNENASIT